MLKNVVIKRCKLSVVNRLSCVSKTSLKSFKTVLKSTEMGFLFDVSENRVDDVKKRLRQHPDDVRDQHYKTFFAETHVTADFNSSLVDDLTCNTFVT